MGRPMNLSIDSKIGTSKNNPQQLIATVIVKVLGSKRLLLFTFFLFFSVPPSPPPPPQLKVKYYKTGVALTRCLLKWEGEN